MSFTSPPNQYGGIDDADDSGVFRYVRIEYSGFELSVDNEINGLTMGSVGSGAEIGHVMVSNTLDDCFEWFGGTVSGSHLVCNNGGDDMFDMDQGWRGNLQFLFGRQVNPVSGNPNGFESDGDKGGATPVTRANVSNVTLCGAGTGGIDIAYGAVLRELLEGRYDNRIVMGFDIGVDARDDFGTVSSPKVELTNSIFFGNTFANVADAAETDNDMGFDENAWVAQASRSNTENDPGVSCGPTGTPDPRPAARISGGAPTGGLDAKADYRGAFADASDGWMTGLWVDWSTN